jgi:Flp pilus assembly pilin Flp
LAFISVVAISVLLRLGNEVKSIFTTITSQLAVAKSSH